MVFKLLARIPVFRRFRKIRIFVVGDFFVEQQRWRFEQYGFRLRAMSNAAWSALRPRQKYRYYCWADYLMRIYLPLRLRECRHARRFACRPVSLFIGTDVLDLMRHPRHYIEEIRKTADLASIMAVHGNLIRELGDLGIPAGLYMLLARPVQPDPAPLPAAFTVAAYVPQIKPVFFGYGTVLKLARDFPDVPFLVMGHDGCDLEAAPNMTFLGHVADTSAVLRRSHCYLRLTWHDGLANLVIEALSLARHVVWTLPFPHCIPYQGYDKLRRDVAALQRGSAPNLEGMRFVASEYSESNIRKFYIGFFK